MSKPKLKKPQDQNPPENEAVSSSIGSNTIQETQVQVEEATPQVVGVEMSDPVPGESKSETGIDALLSRAEARKDVEETVGVEIKRGRGRPKKEKIQDETITNLLAGGLSLAIVALSLPQDAQPSNDQIKRFSSHASAILARHVPLASNNADVIDIIAMFGIVAEWYLMARPVLQRVQKQKANDNPLEVKEAHSLEVNNSGLNLETMTPAEKELFKKAINNEEGNNG